MEHQNFRATYHKIMLVLDNGYCYDTLNMGEQKNVPDNVRSNSALVYGYVDRVCGLSYRVLGLAYYEDGDFTLVWPNDEIGLTVRGECFAQFNFLPVNNRAIQTRFQHEVEIINEGYANPEAEATRQYQYLDPFRHEYFPDDVMVYIRNNEQLKQERIWVKLKQYIGRSKEGIEVFTGKLLDEPFNDLYGMHHNDEIFVGYISGQDESYLLGLPME